MKLAEALQERADLNRKIDDLKRRLGRNILVQEGEAPAEDPAMLLSELDAAIDRLESLMAAINRTNGRTRVNGMTLTELIAKKDALNLRISAYRDAVYTASENTSRARGTEIRVKALLSAAELQKQADALSADLRKLDNLLQETNWKTELK
mgnify:CR=1 FL=1|jgi:uncharacterized coiled-coil DUF342 family protein